MRSAGALKSGKSLDVVVNKQYVRDVTSARNTNQNNRNDASSDDDVGRQMVRAVVERVRQRRWAILFRKCVCQLPVSNPVFLVVELPWEPTTSSSS